MMSLGGVCVLLCDAPMYSKLLACTNTSFAPGSFLTVDPRGTNEELVQLNSLQNPRASRFSKLFSSARAALRANTTNASTPKPSRSLECVRNAPLWLHLNSTLQLAHSKGDMVKVYTGPPEPEEEFEMHPCDSADPTGDKLNSTLNNAYVYAGIPFTTSSVFTYVPLRRFFAKPLIARPDAAAARI